MFCLSGVMALLGASGLQCAVPETMSKRTLPYCATEPALSSSEPERLKEFCWESPIEAEVSEPVKITG